MVTGISGTREWFRKVLRKLPQGQASLIFGVGYAHLKTWATDLDTSEHIHYNPIERLTGAIHALLALKIQIKKDESIPDPEGQMLAEWLAHHFCHLVGHTAQSDAEIVPDQPTWELEALDDAPALGKYQKAVVEFMAGRINPDDLKEAEREVLDEIRRTTRKALIEQGKEISDVFAGIDRGRGSGKTNPRG